MCLSSLASTVFLTLISMNNYPGGTGLTQLNQHLRQSYASRANTTVHLDVYSKMTGASNLLQDPLLATYDRNESLGSPSDYASFEWVLTHDGQALLNEEGLGFRLVQSVKGWAGIRLQIRQYSDAVRTRSIRGLLPATGEGALPWLTRLLPARPLLAEQVFLIAKAPDAEV